MDNLILVDLTEVFLGGANFWLDGLGTRSPVGRTHFTVLFGELEGFQQSQGLFNGSTDWQVVDGDLSQDTLWIDQEDTSEGNTFFFEQDTVVLGQGVVGVGQQWDVDWTQTTVLSGNVGPGQERVFRVGGSKQDFSVLVLELLDGLRVGNDFSWANEGEGQWDESQEDPLTLVLFKSDFFKDTVNDGSLLEGWSWLLDEGNHCISL